MEKDKIKDLATKRDVAGVKKQVNQLGQQVNQLGQQVNQLSQQVNQLSQRVDQVEARFIIVEQKVDHLDQKFDQGFKELNDKFNIVINILDGHSKIFERLDQERIVTNRAIERLDKKSINHEDRITTIEEHLHLE